MFGVEAFADILFVAVGSGTVEVVIAGLEAIFYGMRCIFSFAIPESETDTWNFEVGLDIE